MYVLVNAKTKEVVEELRAETKQEAMQDLHVENAIRKMEKRTPVILCSVKEDAQ